MQIGRHGFSRSEIELTNRVVLSRIFSWGRFRFDLEFPGEISGMDPKSNPISPIGLLWTRPESVDQTGLKQIRSNQFELRTKWTRSNPVRANRRVNQNNAGNPNWFIRVNLPRLEVGCDPTGLWADPVMTSTSWVLISSCWNSFSF